MESQFTGSLTWIYFLGPLIAWPLALYLLSKYKRAVLAAMRASSGLQQGDEDPADEGQAKASPKIALPIAESNLADVVQETVQKQPVNAYLTLARWRTALVYTAGGLVFAGAMSISVLSSEATYSFAAWLGFFVVYSWPAVIVVNYITSPAGARKLVAPCIYAAVFLLTITLVSVVTNATAGFGFLGTFLVSNLVPTLLALAMLNRRIRAVGPTVAVFTIIGLAGLVLAMIVLDVVSGTPGSAAARGVFAIFAYLGLNAIQVILFFLGVGGLLFVGIGWIGNRWMAKQYEDKKLNDQSLTVDAIWLIFGGMQTVLLSTTGVRWSLTIVVAFVLYKLVTAAAFRFTQRAHAQIFPKTDLLFLRVFSLGRKSEAVFDSIAKGWRYIGNIRLITGPDLATTTVEPHEFMRYLGGDIDRLFVANRGMLQQRLESGDQSVDFDQRFRVDDYFCYDNTWKMVLRTLAAQGTPVLMDVRNFSPRNSGVLFELNELVHSVPLNLVVLTTDSTTDYAFLKDALTNAWNSLPAHSPNNVSDPGTLRILRLRHSSPDEIEAVLSELARAEA